MVNNDKLSILIETILSKTSEQRLINELKNIEKDLKPIEIKANVDKIVDDFKILENGTKDIQKRTTELTNEYGQQVKEIETLNEKTKQLVKTREIDTTNYKKQREESQKISETIEKQIKLIQTKAQLLKQNYWTGDFKNIDDFTSNLNSKNIDPNNYKIQLEDLKNQYQLIANNTQESHRNNLSSLQKEIQLETQKNAQTMQNWTKQLDIDAQERKIASDRIKAQMQINAKMDEESQKAQKQIAYYKEQLEIKLADAKTTYGKHFTEQQKQAILSQADLITVENYNDAIKDTTLEYDKQISKSKALRKEATLAMKESDSFMNTLVKDFGKMVAWSVVGTALFGSLRQLQQGLDTLKEIDTIMVDISKVTNYTATDMERLVKNSFDTASNYGRTTQDYLKSIAEFSRAGYEGQAKGLSEVSLLAQNVGELTAEQANEFLLATDAAYKYKGSQEELTRVLDGVNQIDNKFATSIQKVSEGMTVVGSIASNAGVGINELSASLGTMTAITQRPGSEMGKAFRGLIMNLRQIKGDVGDGEIIDDEALSKSAKALDNVNIKVHEMRNGIEELRNPMGVIEELANKWNTLSTVQQAPIIEALGGKYRGNAVVALLENFDMYKKMLTEYTNATGSAMIENEKRMKSWQSKLNQLTNSASNFWNNAIDKNIVKDSISILNEIVKVLDVLVNNSFSAFIIKTGLTSISIYGLMLGIKALAGTQVIGKAIAMIQLMTTNTLGLNLGIAMLSKTMLASPLFWITAGTATIFAIIEAVDFLTVSIEEQTEKVQTLSSELQNLQSTYDQLASKENRTEQEEKYLAILEKQIEAQKTLLANETKLLVRKQYGDKTSPQIADSAFTIGSEVGSIYGEESTDDVDVLKRLNEEILTLDKNNEKSSKTYEKLTKQIAEKTKSLTEEYDANQKNIEILEDANEQGSEEYKILTERNKAIEEVILQEDNLAKSVSNASNATKTEIKSVEELVNTLSKTKEELSTLNSEMSEYQENGKFSSDTLLDLIGKYPELIQYLGDEKQLYEEISKKIQNKTTEIQNSFNTELTVLETSINEKAKGYVEDLKNWKTVEDAKNKITTDMLKQVKEKYDAFVSSTGDETYADLEAEKFAKRLKAKLDATLPDISKYIDIKNLDVGKLLRNDDKSSGNSSSPSLKDSLPQEDLTKELIKSYNAEVDISDAKIKHLERQLKINDETKNYNKELELTNQLISAQEDKVKQLEESNKNMSSEAQKLRDSNKQYNTTEWFDVNGEATLKYKELLNSFAKQSEDILSKTNKNDKDSIKSANEKIDKLNDEKKKVEELFNNIYALKQAWTANVEEIEKTNDSIDGLSQSIVKLNEDQKKNLEDVQKQISEVIKKRYELEKDEAEKAHKKKLNDLDDELDTYKESTEAKIKEIDRLRDAEDFNKSQQKTTDKISELLNERNTLSMAAQSGDLTAIERIKEIDKELAEEHENLSDLQQDREDELRKQNLQDALDDKEKEIKDAEDAEDKKYEIIVTNYEKLLEEGNLYAEANKALTEGMVTDINGKLVTVAEAFKTFSDRFSESLGTLGNNIQKEFVDKLMQAKSLLDSLNGVTTVANTSIETSITPHALGTDNTTKGIKLIGEKGAELEWSNGGTSILPSDLSKQLLNLPSVMNNFLNGISFNIPKVSAVGIGGVSSNINISVPVNVSGGADKVNAMELGNTVAKIIKQELNKSGIFR
ncbi:MAG: phage tail tape measure protein [Tissierellia bacterium]|nr:phage tail tape measure protein [Tissierellia bacterium]